MLASTTVKAEGLRARLLSRDTYFQACLLVARSRRRAYGLDSSRLHDCSRLFYGHDCSLVYIGVRARLLSSILCARLLSSILCARLLSSILCARLLSSILCARLLSSMCTTALFVHNCSRLWARLLHSRLHCASLFLEMYSSQEEKPEVIKSEGLFHFSSFFFF
jgi:hypothetical protein